MDHEEIRGGIHAYHRKGLIAINENLANLPFNRRSMPTSHVVLLFSQIIFANPPKET